MLFVTAFTASAETEITSNITINTTWDLAGSPYILTGDIDVSADADPVLTVEAGVEVRFNSNASLRIGNNTYSENMGGLMVQGTEADPVLFTSNAATPAPGDWEYIYFMRYASDADCSLEWAVFEYGGSTQGLVYVYQAAPEFNNCTFRDSGTRGINCSSTTSAPGVNNCSFIDCIDYPIGIYADQLYRLGSGNSFSGNGTAAIHVTGNRLYYSQTWQPQAVPFRIVSNVEVRGNAGDTSVLTIAPGAILEFETNLQLNIGNDSYSDQLGGLMAENVTFKGVTATAGAWQGILFRRYNAPDSCILTGCTIRDGGGGSSPGNVRIRLNSGATLTGCTFSNGAAFGVYQDDPVTAYITDCSFTGNAGTISLMANDLLYLGAGNSYSGNSDNRIEVRGDTIVRDAVWVTQTTPLHIVGSVDISLPDDYVTLTIQYGAEIEFAAATRFRIGNPTYADRHGALHAIGVTFRGDLAVPGHWYGLTFERHGESSTLSGCTVSDAGYSSNRSLYINLVNPVITGCQILDGNGDGLYLTNGSRPALSGNQVSGHSDYPISLFANDAGALLPGNNLTGNGIDLVEVRYGIISESAVWENPGIPYAPNGTCSVLDPVNLPHLEIRPGCEIQLASNSYFQVGSNAYANQVGSLFAEESCSLIRLQGNITEGYTLPATRLMNYVCLRTVLLNMVAAADRLMYWSISQNRHLMELPCV